MSRKFEVHEFGTLSINGEPKTMNESRYCKADTVFNIGNTIEGAKVTWVYIPELGIYISSVPLLEDVAWSRLDVEGYVSGKVIRIDGQKYLCRLPRGGSAPNTINEWDRILQIMDGFHGCFEKCCHPFWCQEAVEGNPKYRVTRGSYTYGSLKVRSYEKEDCGAGFRVVLEPIIKVNKQEVSIPEALTLLEIMATNLTGEAASMSGEQAEYAFRKIQAVDAAIEALARKN